jgi:hypothetical protein
VSKASAVTEAGAVTVRVGAPAAAGTRSTARIAIVAKRIEEHGIDSV